MVLAIEKRQDATRAHKLSHLHPDTGLRQQIQDGLFSFSERAAMLAHQYIQTGRRNSDYFKSHTGKKLIVRVAEVQKRRTRNTYISEEFHHADRFWENCLTKADSFITYVISELFPNMGNSAELLDEVALITGEPEAMIPEMAESGNPKKRRYEHELLRKRFLAELIAGTRSQSHEQQQKKELKQIHEVLDERLFLDGVGVTNEVFTYATHDSTTGKVISLSPTRPPIENLPFGTHVRTYKAEARRVEVNDGEILNVLCHVREKPIESTVGKMLRHAIEHPEGIIRPEINDIKGVILVAKGIQSSFDPRVTQLVEKSTNLVVSYLKEYLRALYGEDKEIEVIKDDKDGTVKHNGQSDQIHYQRRLIVVEGRHPIELMYYGEGDYIDNEFHVGKYNPITGLYTGGARSLYSKGRLMQTIPYLYPTKIKGTRINAYEGLEEEARRTYMAEAQRLLALRDMQQAA